MAFHMKYALTLALAVSWHPLADAAGPLPSDLTGTWSTGKSPYVNGTKQIDMYLEANGSGVLAGSTAPARNVNGADDETSGRSMLLGMRIQAALEGDILKARPFPAGGRNAEEAARMTLICHYDVAGPNLICMDPNGVTINMQRRSETITADVAEMRAAIRAQTSGQ
jgi:hypothetical protein